MTDRYAVFGNPIGHSKSPLIHAEFARQTGDSIDYGAIEAPLDGFGRAVRRFIDAGGAGINITVPFKIEALDLATEIRESARLAGATNCLKFGRDGAVVAENFDGIGLVNDIVRNLGIPIAGKRVLFAGAGGATRGAVLPFIHAHPARIVIANRTVSRAEDIRNRLASEGEIEAVSYPALEGERFDLVLNATSMGLTGDAPALPDSVFDAAELAYDLVYGKGLTPFLRSARSAGVGKVVDGVGMLVEQAAEAFTWWRGARPDTAPVIEKLTVPLE